jgi:hypothetical protein
MLFDRGPMRMQSSPLSVLNAALWIAILVSGSGCAKIAEPLPPEAHIPQPATALKAFQLADSIMLTVPQPVRNTNGSPAKTLAKVQVLRIIEGTNEGKTEQPLSKEEFIKKADPILTITASHFSEYLREGVFAIQDTLPLSIKSRMYSSAFRYAILFVNNKNQAAGLSNQAFIAPVPIPPAPDDLESEVTENAIRLRWTAPASNMDGSKPARIAGYDIYRMEEPGRVASKPINAYPLQKPEYEDRDFQFDKTYYYAVRTLGSLENPYAESLPSKIHPVVARDVFPPAPPENFNAIREGNDIILLWAPSTSGDVAGYRIYRQTKGSPTRQLLQDALIAGLSFRDGKADPKADYIYTIQAVDMHGNESTTVQTELHGP